jgi:hypothetical protein
MKIPVNNPPEYDSPGASLEHHMQLPCITDLLPNAKLRMTGAHQNGSSQFSCCRFEERQVLHARGLDGRSPSGSSRYQISMYLWATKVAVYRTFVPSRRGEGLGYGPVKRAVVVEIKLDSGNIPHLVTAYLLVCGSSLIR